MIIGLDTNVILNEIETLMIDEEYSEVIFGIPNRVLGEIDKLKEFGKTSEVKYKARNANRIINQFINSGKCKILSREKIKSNDILEVMSSLLTNKSPDDDIVSTFVENDIQKVMTNDLNMKAKLATFKIKAFSYHDKINTNYNGYTDIVVDNDLYCSLLNKTHIPTLSDDFILSLDKLYPYTCIKCINELEPSMSLLFIYDYHNKTLVDVRDIQKTLMFYQSIKPLNSEQAVFMWLLQNENIKAVASDSKAGVGKNLLSTSYALQAVDDKLYKRFMYLKSTAKVGDNSLGFYKGDKISKLEQEIYPPLIYSLNKIYKHDTLIDTKMTLSYLIEKGNIVPENLGDIRGISLSSSIVVLDENANNDINVTISALSRLEEDSKIIILGSSQQIDNPRMNKYNNGLTLLINSENFKDSPITASFNMSKAERSELAQLTSNIYNEYNG